MNRLTQQGFTLIEMIMVIVISGILLSIMSVFIAQPIQGFIDLSRRATLVYAAENALRRMQRDVRLALPNSLRVTGNALEIITTVEGARYRTNLPGNQNARLRFNNDDTDFDILGNFNNISLPFTSNTHRIAIYNIAGVDGSGNALDGSNAYGGGDPNVITPAGRTITITDNGDEDHVKISGVGWHFAYESPQQRMYLVDTAVSYICNGNQLERHTGYNFTNSVQPPAPTINPALMADNVISCSFTYAPGTSQRAGLLTLDLTIQDSATGEKIRLLQQVHTDNVP